MTHIDFLYNDTIDKATGVSSSTNIAKPILALASHSFGSESFRRPGHASVNLVKLAGLDQVSILSTIVNPKDGSIPQLNRLQK
uniref:Uncharacterized protein n=1 Tax=Lactuca sativa TaxID=4236 RepID=A0A9R1V529_LACSA|nr:hypothetical protein LSAT_V11C700354840 [Lactuca sativa]